MEDPTSQTAPRPNTVNLPLTERPYVIVLVRAARTLRTPADIGATLTDFKCTHGLTDGRDENKRTLSIIAQALDRKPTGLRDMDMSRNALTPRQRLLGGIAMFPEGAHVLVVADARFIDEALQEIFRDPTAPDVEAQIPRVTSFKQATIAFAVEVFTGHPKDRSFRCSLQPDELTGAPTSC